MKEKFASEINDQLDRLAAFEPTTFPVISLYLNAEADQHGQDHFQPFVRKELPARARTYPLRSPERASFERDIERINEYLRDQVRPEANTMAIFACAGNGDFFETAQLAASIGENRLFVGPQPHLYPLARLYDQYRRYAVLIANTHFARLYVFGVGKSLDQKTVTNIRMNRTQTGGWSQARYQRHVDHHYLHHAKEIVEALERVVRVDQVDQILLAGDEVIIPILREQLPPKLADMVLEELKLDMRTPEHEVLKATLEVVRKQDARSDEEKVSRLLDEYRAGALGVVGGRETLMAVTAGQVNELLISSRPETIQNDLDEEAAQLIASGTPAGQAPSEEPGGIALAEALVMRARQTGARVTFIENPALLADVGGVGALLRYRI